jgi:uncharacterized repeat protein (TIGR03833 family)
MGSGYILAQTRIALGGITTTPPLPAFSGMQAAERRSILSAMSKHSADGAPKEQTAFANNPFAKLARNSALAAKQASVVPTPAATSRPSTSPAPRLVVRHEAVGRSGKVVTRISGVPAGVRDTVAARLRKSLGCVAEVDAEDVVLAGSLRERVNEWLQKIGDLRKLAEDRPAQAKASPARPEPPAAPALAVTNASGTYRRNVRPGMRVGVVMKEDQPSGELTMGVVRDLLTNSEEHPRGIKVRLVSGQVGRVKVIYA